MTTLRDQLDRRAGALAPDRDAFARVLQRADRRRTRRRMTAGVVGVVVALVAVANVWWAFGRGPSTPATPTPTAGPTALDLRIGLRTAPDVGFNLAASDGSVWVQGNRLGENRLVELDPATGTVRAETRNGADYDYTALAAIDGGVVVASGSSVRWSVDGHEGGADVGGTAVDAEILDGDAWVLTADAVFDLWRIDLTTGRSHRLSSLGYPLDVTDIGGPLAAGEGALWVATTRGVLRVDPISETATPLAVGTDPVVAGGSVWFVDGSSLVAIDPRTGDELHQVPLGKSVASLASDGTRVWVLTETGSKREDIYVPDPTDPATVLVVDAVAGVPLAEPIPLPEDLPGRLAASDGHAWIAFHQSGRVYRIDTCGVPC